MNRTPKHSHDFAFYVGTNICLLAIIAMASALLWLH